MYSLPTPKLGPTLGIGRCAFFAATLLLSGASHAADTILGAALEAKGADPQAVNAADAAWNLGGTLGQGANASPNPLGPFLSLTANGPTLACDLTVIENRAIDNRISLEAARLRVKGDHARAGKLEQISQYMTQYLRPLLSKLCAKLHGEPTNATGGGEGDGGDSGSGDGGKGGEDGAQGEGLPDEGSVANNTSKKCQAKCAPLYDTFTRLSKIVKNLHRSLEAARALLAELEQEAARLEAVAAKSEAEASKPGPVVTPANLYDPATASALKKHNDDRSRARFDRDRANAAWKEAEAQKAEVNRREITFEWTLGEAKKTWLKYLDCLDQCFKKAVLSGGPPPNVVFVGDGPWHLYELAAELEQRRDREKAGLQRMGVYRKGYGTFVGQQSHIGGDFEQDSICPAGINAHVAPGEALRIDVNHDDLPDVMFLDATQNALGVAIGDGPFSFAPAETYNLGLGVLGVSLVDVDGDCELDIVSSHAPALSPAPVIGGTDDYDITTEVRFGFGDGGFEVESTGTMEDSVYIDETFTSIGDLPKIAPILPAAGSKSLTLMPTAPSITLNPSFGITPVLQ